VGTQSRLVLGLGLKGVFADGQHTCREVLCARMSGGVGSPAGSAVERRNTDVRHRAFCTRSWWRQVLMGARLAARGATRSADERSWHHSDDGFTLSWSYTMKAYAR
jgi:hypothetical protein